MPLSKRSIELLLDLVEIKLGMIEVSDREDQREYKDLERCKTELDEARTSARTSSASLQRPRKVA